MYNLNFITIMLKKIPKTAFFQTPKNLNSTGPKLGIIWNSTSKPPPPPSSSHPKKKKKKFNQSPPPKLCNPKAQNIDAAFYKTITHSWVFFLFLLFKNQTLTSFWSFWITIASYKWNFVLTSIYEYFNSCELRLIISNWDRVEAKRIKSRSIT